MRSVCTFRYAPLKTKWRMTENIGFTAELITVNNNINSYEMTSECHRINKYQICVSKNWIFNVSILGWRWLFRRKKVTTAPSNIGKSVWGIGINLVTSFSGIPSRRASRREDKASRLCLMVAWGFAISHEMQSHVKWYLGPSSIARATDGFINFRSSLQRKKNLT